MKNVKIKRWPLILGVLLIIVGISGLSDYFLLAVAILIFGIYILYRVLSKEKGIPKSEDKEAQIPREMKTNEVLFQISSAEHFQSERKRTFQKSGNVANSIESETVFVKVEKTNKQDPNALAVYLHGIKIGYLYQSDQQLFNSIKDKKHMHIRQYYYNNQYRAELIVGPMDYRYEYAPAPKNNDRKVYDYIKPRKLVNDITVLDFETTGLSPVDNEIIQIGAIKYRNEREIDRFSCYIQPSAPISPKITKITGITNDMVEEAPPISDVLNDLNTFLEKETIVAHNASFDMRFLLENLERYQINHNKFRVIDTLSLARKHINETPNHKLETLKNFLRIEAGSHDAIEDCIVTAKLYYYCKRVQEAKQT